MRVSEDLYELNCLVDLSYFADYCGTLIYKYGS